MNFILRRHALRLIVSDEQVGLRIDKLFSEAYKEQWSRACIQKSIRQGHLSVNNHVIDSLNYRVKLNDVCVLNIQSPEAIVLTPQKSDLNILFEDEDLIVINKPEGQVVHLGNGVQPGSTLVETLLAYCPLSAAAGAERPGVVHRLDQATSGLILFDKTDTAYWALTRMFAERKIHKTYHAFVWGIPKFQSGTIDAPIGRSQRDRTAMCITNSGREARTTWELLEAFPKANKALLACHPVTGRTHQIRVHLKSIGHTIVGDPKYGKIPDKRLFLHAYKIEFEHPITHQACFFVASYPASFEEELKILRS